jgi:hypothetical protein
MVYKDSADRQGSYAVQLINAFHDMTRIGQRSGRLWMLRRCRSTLFPTKLELFA